MFETGFPFLKQPKMVVYDRSVLSVIDKVFLFPRIFLHVEQHARGIFLYLLDYELEMLQFALITREAEAGS